MSTRRLGAAPPVAAVLAFGLFAASFLQRFDGLAVPAYDTAFFEQVAWNVAHGNGWTSGFYPEHFLGLHFEPLLAGPALAQLVSPDARGLSLIGLAGLNLSAPAAYAFAQELLVGLNGGRLVAAALAAPLPIWPPMQEAARAGFHTEYLALPLLFLCGWAGLRRRWWLCSATALAALCAKEDQAYAVAVIGLVIAVAGKSRRAGVALSLLALTWGAIVTLAVMPQLRGAAENEIAAYYAWLGQADAGALAHALAAPAGWLAALAMLACAAGLPLLKAGWLALALPPLTADLLSRHVPQADLHLQYGLPLVLPVFLAAVLGARALLPRLAAAGPLLPLLALPPLLIGLLTGPLLGARVEAPASALAQLRACTVRLPAEAAVSADDYAAAALAARPVLRPLTYARPGDYVLVDGWERPPAHINAGARRDLLAALPAQGRARLCDDGRFQLWGPAGG